jgi:type IX secretion system PorP/SprF family membrane protein
MKKYAVAIILSLALFDVPLRAQDPTFSQFYHSPLYLNPALAGQEEYGLLNFAHRSQWRNLQFPYTTYQTSVILPYFRDKHLKPDGHLGGVGVSMYGDLSGIGRNLRTYGGNVTFAYNVPLARSNRSRLSFALQAGFIHKRVDKDELQWGEQYNPFIGFDNTVIPADLDRINNSTFLDITAGAFYRYFAPSSSSLLQSFYAGFVAAHLNHPDESVLDGETNRMPVLYKLHGGFIFGLSEKTSISLNYLSQQQSDVNQTNFGVILNYAMPIESKGALSGLVVKGGTWYRVQDSFIAVLAFATNHLEIGFSYDWNTTSLRYNQRGAGSYEITLGYRFYKPGPPKVMY